MKTKENGIVTRINGPIIHARNLAGVEMYEVVYVGELELVGEVVRIENDRCVIQVYEDPTGVKPGEKVVTTGGPLSLTLGPGLIGSIYDGLQRSLIEIDNTGSAYIKRGLKVHSLPADKAWPFKPLVEKGARVAGGTIIGTVQETPLIEHRIMIPPGVEGEIVEIVGDGEYDIETVIARVKNGTRTTDIKMYQKWPVRRPRPYKIRHRSDKPLVTGQRIIDTFFPIAKGGCAAIPGGFGTGKTMTQHALAKWCDAQIIIYVGCGERGNEMTEVLVEFPELKDPRSGRSLMERTTLVANTSNMPVAAREVSIYTGITIAEYFRDMGYDVALMADSTSRWAEALRELSARLEEMPVEEGFPAHLPSNLAGFYERGGLVETLNGRDGSISIVGSVSPPGGDFSEPVTQHTKRFIRCFWALDTVLANARHYPAIHWLTSYSEYVDDVAEWWREREPEWLAMRNTAMEIMQREDKLQQIVKLVGPDVLPDSQKLVLLLADVIKVAFLQQNAFDETDMWCSPEKQMMMLKCIVMLWQRGGEVVGRGAPLREVRDMPCVQALMRTKNTIASDDAGALAALYGRIDEELRKVEESYL